MTDQLPAQTRERDHESDIDESSQKGQKADGESEPATDVQAKTITNIYYDCLERIFDFLDLQSLLNVAGTCKRLQIAAAAKFGDDFGTKLVSIQCTGGTREPMYEIYEDFIRIRSLKFCFPFLRCFGAKIRRLSLDSHNDHVDSYVYEYCADTLIDICYRGRSSFPTQAFQKPFKRIERVKLFRCELQDQLPNFVDWFPNMQLLQMRKCSVDATATAVHFPCLELLFIGINPLIGNLTLEHAKNLFQSNQQLQFIGLDVDAGVIFCTLLDMLQSNPILILKVRVSEGFDDVTMTDLNQFAVEHPSVLKLEFKNYRFAADDVINFIQKMNKLGSFHFLVKGRSECDRLVDQLGEEWQHQIEAAQDDSFEITLNR